MSYTRTIGRTTTNATPAWRAAMASTRTVYTAGPASLNLTLVPTAPANPGGGTAPSKFTELTGPARLPRGWNCSAHVRGAGQFGYLIYREAGENYWGNAATAFNLTTGQWEWWQGNHFCLTEAEAIAQDSDTYWDPVMAAGLPTVQKALEGNSTWYANWDAAGNPYPLALFGEWILRRKFTSHSHGNGRQWSGRYNSMCTIPAHMSGTGRDAIVYNTQSWRGPFVSPMPSGYRPFSNWAAVPGTVGGDPPPRCPVYAQDPSTKTDVQLCTVTDGANFGVNNAASVVDEFTKRVYYYQFTTGHQLYYVDFSAGQSAATAVPSLITLSTAGDATLAVGDHTSVAFTHAHPTGRRLMFFRAERFPDQTSTRNALIMIDLANNTFYGLGPIPGLDMDRAGLTQPYCGMDYIPEQGTYGTLVLTTKTTDRGMLMHEIPLPADPTSAANYSATTRTLPPASGVTLETMPSGDLNGFMYGKGKGGYLPDLGVIGVIQYDGPMLFYRPF